MTAAINRCDGLLLHDLAFAAQQWLETNVEMVNALNVFPVPDGDTGTNMLLTMRSATEEVGENREASVSKVASAISHGALMGARGNSGVILSQLWRGLARGLDSVETATTSDFARAFNEASETAYRGVVRPVEGTILTVSRDIADEAALAATETDDLVEFLGRLVFAGHGSVSRTPDLLPVLKQAGVVDSGGQGLVMLIEGMHRHLTGQDLAEAAYVMRPALTLDAVGAAMDEVEPGQEWEVIVDFRPNGELELGEFYSRLELMGTSIQVGQGDRLVRMHIHLLKDKRYEPIEYCESLGTVTNVAMENLLDQLAQQAHQPSELVVKPDQVMMVVVSPGPGFSRIFDAKTVQVVTGGQTMNPSTKDLLAAFEDAPTDKVIILPNNKNIQLAAEQAAEVSVKKVRVVPSRTMPQGVAAMLAYNPDGELDEVSDAMKATLDEVESGELTVATRTVQLDGVDVTEGQFIGLHNGKLTVAGEDMVAVLFDLLEAMEVEELELVTLFYGEGVNAKTAEDIGEQIGARYPDIELEVHHGGQPHYHFIVSAE